MLQGILLGVASSKEKALEITSKVQQQELVGAIQSDKGNTC